MKPGAMLNWFVDFVGEVPLFSLKSDVQFLLTVIKLTISFCQLPTEIILISFDICSFKDHHGSSKAWRQTQTNDGNA